MPRGRAWAGVGRGFARLSRPAALAGALTLLAPTRAAFLPASAAATAAEPAPVPADEHARTVAAMRPPKRPGRPVVAVVGQNDGTETTDYLVPFAVLAGSGVAETVALATEARPLKLMPALAVEPQATVAEFDARHPDGADYVVVPALHRHDDHAAVAWIRAQAAKGATVVGVCSGVRTVSATGLLAGRSATGHWYDLDDLRKANPSTSWVGDRRYVADRGVVTTTGVSASLPVSLALVEAIAGRDRAAALAEELGAAAWDARHDSAAFGLGWRAISTAAANRIAALWRREAHGLPVAAGVDEVALAFAADAWSRTYRSSALAVAERPGPVETRHGLKLLPDRSGGAGGRGLASVLPAPAGGKPAAALPDALAGIAIRYGEGTASFVALQLEYQWRPGR